MLRTIVLVCAVGMLASASDDTFKCDSPLDPGQSVGLVIGTIAGAALLVTLASYAAGLAPVARSREDDTD